MNAGIRSTSQYCIFSNKRPRCLLNFETARCGAYQRVAFISKLVKYQMSKSCNFFFENQNKTYIFTINKSNITKKPKYQQYFLLFYSLHIYFMCILVQLLVAYSNYSNKHYIIRGRCLFHVDTKRCSAYYRAALL